MNDLDILNDFVDIKNSNANKFMSLIKNLLATDKITLTEYQYLCTFDKNFSSLVNSSWFIEILNNTGDTELINEIIKKFNNVVNIKNSVLDIDIKYIFNDILKKHTFKLTSDQKKSVKKIAKFIVDKDRYYYGLYGYAGTGKTTTLVEIVSFLLHKKLIKSIALTAPTHQALQVIKSKFKSHIKSLYESYICEPVADTEFNYDDTLIRLKDHNINIEFITIHRLLNFKSDYTVDGDKIFINAGKSLIDEFELVVVDECSMIPVNIVDCLFDCIYKLKSGKFGFNYKKYPKVLFSGDPAQLPPVGEDVSLLFQKDLEKNFTFKIYKDTVNKLDSSFEDIILNSRYEILIETIKNMDNFTMKEVVRSSKKDVVDTCYEIRKWVNNEVKFPNLSKFVKANGVNIFQYIKGNKKTDNEWFKKCIGEFKDSKDSCTILTWTNKQTDEYNDKIRNLLFGDKISDRFVVGEILKLADSYNIDDDVSSVFHTSQQIKVIAIEKIFKNIDHFKRKLNPSTSKLKNKELFESKVIPYIDKINSQISKKYKCWKLDVIRMGANELKDKKYTIYVIDKESEKDIDRDKKISFEIITEIRNSLNKSFHKKIDQIDEHIIKHLRREWYEIFVEPFANTNYGYSITCHKAQGSNCYNVYVDANDILQNIRESELKRCLYTAVTRTCNNLFILI